MLERGIGFDIVRILRLIGARDKGRMTARITLDRFTDPENKVAKFIKGGGSIDEAVKLFGGYIGRSQYKYNLLLNEGIDAMWTLICGGGGTAYNNANARIGVGESAEGASAEQDGLQGLTTEFKGMDDGYPTYGSDQKATWRSTFNGNEANFEWNEITVDNGAVADLNINRKVQAMGTKAEGTTWIATLEITLA